MKENEGITKVKDRKVKDRLDVIILEVVRFWGEIRKYALIDEVERIASIVLPERKGRETIRKRIDKLMKSGILIRGGGYKNAIIKVSPKAMVNETVKPFAEEVRKRIKLQREEKLLIQELRIKHTERIRKQAIEPMKLLINLLWKLTQGYDRDKIVEHLKRNEKLRNFNYSLLMDLIENHLPGDIQYKYYELLKEISKVAKELAKLKKENSDFLNNLKIIESKFKLVKNIVDLRLLIDELEAYEVLPGVCKYITGGD